MKYKFLLLLFFFAAIAHIGFAQSPSQSALEEVKSLKAYFSLSSEQEDSLMVTLPAYYTAKVNFLQRPNRTAADTKNLQKFHDDIVKKILSTQQVEQYEDLRRQQLQILKQRTDSTRNQ